MAVPDVGQAAVTAFVNAAVAGEITYEPGTAEQAAKDYDLVIDELKHHRLRIREQVQMTGFGGFQSGLELQQGSSARLLRPSNS
jgi:hypothetical protein